MDSFERNLDNYITGSRCRSYTEDTICPKCGELNRDVPCFEEYGMQFFKDEEAQCIHCGWYLMEDYDG